MKAEQLIQYLLPFKDRNFDVVIVDNDETLVSKDIDVSISPDKLIENKENKYISAIINENDNVISDVIYIRLNDFYLEEDYWKNN